MLYFLGRDTSIDIRLRLLSASSYVATRAKQGASVRSNNINGIVQHRLN